MIERLASLALAHLRLSMWAIVLGAAISLPLGVIAARRPRLERAVLAVASVIQTIPGLALLAVMVPALAALSRPLHRAVGVELPSIGALPAVLGLTLYSLLPILRNVVVGLREVDPTAKRAALGVGMTARQSLLHVELPLALPTIVAGLRTATVWTVGMATLATPIGARSLGDLIFSGLQLRDHGAVLAGCVASAVLALALDGLIRLGESGVRRRARARWMTASLALGAIAGWALLSPLAALGEAPRVRIGQKPFTEQHVLAALMADRVREAGAVPEVLGSLGSTVAFDALVAGDLDVYVEYTGTLYATAMRRDAIGIPREVVFREVRDWLARERGVVVVARLGFENAYALAVRAPGDGGPTSVRTLSELAPRTPSLVVGGDYELFERAEWRSLVDTYGFHFRAQRTMDPTLLYAAVAEREVDVIGAYTTDGRIAAYDLVVLDDDRGAIPPYDAIVLANGDFAASHPEVVAALAGLDGTIDASLMRAMNRAVDVDAEAPEHVAQRLGPRRAAPR